MSAGRVVLAGSNNATGDGDKPDIRDAVLTSILSAEPEDDWNPRTNAIRGLGLTVVSNALCTLEIGDLSATGKMHEPPFRVVESYLSHVDGRFGLDLLNVLMDCLSKAQENMHNSCLAAQCLHVLCRSSKKVKNAIQDQGGKDVAVVTLGVARCTSLRLQKATEQLLPSLGTRIPAMVITCCKS
uniref:Uncharacterized protein n=1 Tax=Trieres chinensis TaxID=1514140 RepID=A0A7S1ZU95_TRICV